jgi:hypothetical protein
MKETRPCEVLVTARQYIVTAHTAGLAHRLALLEVNRTKIKCLLRRSMQLTAWEERGFVAFMAIGVERDGPKPTASEIPESAKVEWNLAEALIILLCRFAAQAKESLTRPFRLKVCVDIAEVPTETYVDTLESPCVVPLCVGEDSSPSLVL